MSDIIKELETLKEQYLTVARQHEMGMVANKGAAEGVQECINRIVNVDKEPVQIPFTPEEAARGL